MEDDNLEYNLYIMAELAYKKANPEAKEEELYPFDWYSHNNYKLKTEIIAEAIQNKKLIRDTEKYRLLQEHVE